MLDSEQNVKLGDFGLAVASAARHANTPAHERPPRAASSLRESSISMGVGTFLYRAPEVSTLHARGFAEGIKYGAPADIFSLGVVLFELFNPPFSTAMERATSIQRMREHNGRAEGLPTVFVSSAPKAVLALLKSMLSSDPAERPSAAELLGSPFIPHRVDIDDEMLQAPNSALFSSVLRGVFSRPTPDFRDLSFDLVERASHSLRGHGAAARHTSSTVWEHSNMAEHSTHASDAAFLTRLLARVFERCGSVRYDAHDITPRPAPMSSFSLLSLNRQLSSALVHGDAAHADSLVTLSTDLGLPSRNLGSGAAARGHPLQDSLTHLFSSLPPPILSPLAVAVQSPSVALVSGGSSRLAKAMSLPAAVQLADPEGTVVLLPFDLCHPFARFLARHSVSHVKRHCTGHVYRQREGGGQPRRYAEAAFDVVWPSSVNQPAESLALSGAADAEVIGASIEVVSAALALTPGTSRAGSSFFVRLSNSRILSGLIDALSVPPTSIGVLCDLLTATSVANLTNAPPLGATGAVGGSVAASLWPDVRSFLLSKHQLSQTVTDSLRPFLAPAMPWTVPSLCAEVETFVGRQRRLVEKRLLPVLLGADARVGHAMPGAPAGPTDAAERRAALQQMRGLMLMAQGARELRSTFMLLTAAEKGNITEAASLCPGATCVSTTSSAGTASAVPMGRHGPSAGSASGHKLPQIDIGRVPAIEQLLSHGQTLVLDLGLIEPRNYHGTVFQIVLKPLAAATQGGTSLRTARSADGRSAGGAVEALLKIGIAFSQGCDADCVARGGRYDELILRYQPPGVDIEVPAAARALVVAMQVRFGVEKFSKTLRALATLHSRSGKSRHGEFLTAPRPLLPRCDVLVCSVYHGHSDDSSGSDLALLDDLLYYRRCLAAIYFSAGISADYLHPVLRGYESAAAYASLLGARVLCVVRRDAAVALRVRLRDMSSGKDDIDVTGADAVSATARILHGAALALHSQATAAMQFAAPDVPISGQLGGVFPITLRGGAGGANATGEKSGANPGTPSLLVQGAAGGDMSGGSTSSGMHVDVHLVGLGDDAKHKRAAAAERRALTRLRESGILAGIAAAAGVGQVAGGSVVRSTGSGPRPSVHLLVLDAPFRAVRDVVTAFATSDSIDDASALLFGRLDKDFFRHKALLRDALELLFRLSSSALRAGGSTGTPGGSSALGDVRLVVFSTVDDRFDTAS